MALVLATVSNEIDWLIQKDMRVSPRDALNDGEPQPVSWQTMTDAIKIHAPEDTLLAISHMQGDYLAYRARMMTPHGFLYFVHVNQWTGEVTGTSHPITVQRFFRDLHRYIFMPSILGLPIVTSMAFILAISLYTGLKTTRKWRKTMTSVRTDRGSRAFVADAHKAVGLWAVWFILLMIVTSIWYLVEFGFNIANVAADTHLAFEPERPKISETRLQEYGDIIESRRTEDIVKSAHLAFPELKITSILFPFSPSQTITVLGKRNNPLLRSRANRVFLDPVSLAPIKVQRSEEIGWVAWLNETADPLHFGFFGGLTTKLIWFVFGLGLTGLSITGVWMTWKKLRSRAISRAQFFTMPVLLVGLVFGYFRWLPLYSSPELTGRSITLNRVTEGALSITPRVGLSAENLPTGEIHLYIETDSGRPNIKDIRVSDNSALARDAEHTNGTRARARVIGRHTLAIAQLDGEQVIQSGEIYTSIKLHSGAVVNAHWPIETSSDEEYSVQIQPLTK